MRSREDVSRKPDEVDADFMQPLESLPIFLSLQGRRVVVVGNSDAAAWKADLAAASGATVDVYAQAPCAKLLELARRRANVALHASEPQLDGAALVFAALERDEEALALREKAKAAGALLGLVDRPEMSDFSMGAIVNRSPLVIGVSTGAPRPCSLRRCAGASRR